MKDNWSQTQIVELWRENEKLKMQISDIKKENENLKNGIDKLAKELDILKSKADGWKRISDGKTTLSELTMKEDKTPIALSQKVIEEWMLTEQERKQLERERKEAGN